MRVDRLHVICIRRQDPFSLEFQDPQFFAEAKALAMRAVILEKTGTAEIIEYSPCTYKKVGDVPDVASGPKRIGAGEKVIGTERIATSPRVGVYIIAHGSQEGMSGISFADLALILNECGIKKIDKMSFISCTIGKDFAGSNLPGSWRLEGVPENEFRSYLARMCGFLGLNDYGNGENGKIMVAGWINYVTVAFPGRREESALGKKTTKKETWEPFEKGDKKAILNMNSGRKYAQDILDKDKKKPVHEIREKHIDGVGKVFFAWSRDGGLRRIQEAAWTDRR